MSALRDGVAAISADIIARQSGSRAELAIMLERQRSNGAMAREASSRMASEPGAFEWQSAQTGAVTKASSSTARVVASGGSGGGGVEPSPGSSSTWPSASATTLPKVFSAAVSDNAGDRHVQRLSNIHQWTKGSSAKLNPHERGFIT